MPVNLVNFVDRAYVLVIQASGRLRFPQEAGLVFGVFDCVPGEELQRDRSFELGVLGLVDDTHAPPADFGEDLVMTDRGVDHDGSILAQDG